uniref:Z62r protein n=1 Tax=Vibrio cholerae TaxID=666 RepID=O87069_VIBCL|nr:z62r [Vibrio cholerae]
MMKMAVKCYLSLSMVTLRLQDKVWWLKPSTCLKRVVSASVVQYVSWSITKWASRHQTHAILAQPCTVPILPRWYRHRFST